MTLFNPSMDVIFEQLAFLCHIQRVLVQITGLMLAIVTNIYCGFPLFFKANAGIVS
jgi:hypothetical protein